MRVFMVTCFLSTLIGTSAAVSAPLSSSDDVKNNIVGNTISGEENGKTYLEYIDPSGIIIGEDSEGRYKGKWRIKNSQICFHYEDDKPKDWDCVQVDVDGPKVIWIDPDKVKTTSKLVPGKPGGW